MNNGRGRYGCCSHSRPEPKPESQSSKLRRAANLRLRAAELIEQAERIERGA